VRTLDSTAAEQQVAELAEGRLQLLNTLVEKLESEPISARVNGLVAELKRAPASPELQTFICETLEKPALHELVDSKGVALRWHLVERLLQLGFPHALSVSPEDLDYHRRRGRKGRLVWSRATVVSGVVSSLSAIGWSSLLASAGPEALIELAPVAILLFISLGHGLAAVVSGITQIRSGRARALRFLGRMLFIGPTAAVVCGFIGGRFGLLMAGVVALPATLTALFASLASRHESAD
jgi:hypothetical protein